MARTGIVYIKIRVKLNSDIPEESVEEFVNDLDYNVTDDNGLVANTEIVAAGTSEDI